MILILGSPVQPITEWRSCKVDMPVIGGKNTDDDDDRLALRISRESRRLMCADSQRAMLGDLVFFASKVL